MNRRITTAVLQVVTGAISFGILGTFVKLAQRDGYDLPAVTFAQVAMGVLLLLIINLFIKKRNHPARAFTKGEKVKVILHGMCVGLISTFYFLSIRYGSAATSIVLLAQSVWMGIVLECILTRSFPSVQKIIMIAVILAGTLLATNVLITGSNISVAGIISGLLAAIANTASIYFSGFLVVNKSPERRTLYLGIGCLLMVSLIYGYSFIQHFDARILWKWGIVLGLTAMVIPPLLYIRGMPVLGVGLSSVITCLQIPASAIFAWWILHEQVNGYQWWGIILIVAGIAGMNIQRNRAKNTANP